MKRLFFAPIMILLMVPNHGFAQPACPTCVQVELPKLVITRSGEVKTQPDLANLRLSVWVEEQKADWAVKKAKEKMQRAIEAIKANGVKEEDIKTLEYRVTPMFEGKKIFSSVPRPTSYAVSQIVEAQIRNLEEVGTLLGQISGMDYLNIQEISFTSSRIEDLKRQALQKAAQEARQTALDLAQTAGAKLGKVLLIEESAHIMPAREPMMKGVLAETAKFDMGSSTDMPVSSGMLNIKASVTLTYALE